MNVRSTTKKFFQDIEVFLKGQEMASEMDLSSLRTIIYRDLDDLIASEEDIDFGKRIGKGASSQVYYGSYKFCPCAIKRINMDIMNAKQIVSDKEVPKRS